MLDVVVVAMVAVLILLAISIGLVRSGRLKWHRNLQTTLAVVLAVTVAAFEIEMRFFVNWRDLAAPSPFYAGGWVDRSLWLHLAFAIPTPFVWGYVLCQAWRKIEWNSDRYRVRHRRWGWCATLLMLLTAVTGWLFYWIAFAA